MNPEDNFLPRFPLGEGVDAGFRWLKENWKPFFDLLKDGMKFLVEGLSEVLLAVPAIPAIVIFALIAWFLRSWKLAVGTVITFTLVLMMDKWVSMMQTMSLVIIATLFAVIIAVPVGIWAARNDTVSAIVKPVLDFMQTMPAFVYLIPAVTFFSIGAGPALVATIIFSLPPGVRMTELGIRQVDAETVEAGHAFGATSRQILRGIQLPLAVPTIMAGINQLIMLALSMAVIAGMVGLDGLGKDVVESISTLRLPLGVEAGVAVVFLAIYLDRLTAALGRPGDFPSSLRSLLRQRRETQKTA